MHYAVLGYTSRIILNCPQILQLSHHQLPMKRNQSCAQDGQCTPRFYHRWNRDQLPPRLVRIDQCAPCPAFASLLFTLAVLGRSFRG